MFLVGTTVRYGQSGVCRIEEIRSMKMGESSQDYYVLMPLYKEGSVLFVPCENETLVSKMLPLLTPEEIEEILEDVKNRPAEWLCDFRRRSDSSKKALNSGDRRDALYLIKNICQHKKEAVGAGKRIHTTDDYFLKDAENLIYHEFAFVLGKEFSEVAEWVQKTLEL